METEEIKLTQFSKGSGCGCKIAPDKLQSILKNIPAFKSNDLLVGSDTNDDAAVLRFINDDCIISTTDFFTPIVDSPYHFGRIAAANAISDVYAMGGKPLMALSILGWPMEKLPLDTLQEVMKGATDICIENNIILAGGHSIDIPEPVFGLAVTGTVKTKNLKRNNTSKPGDLIYITKPIGIGILSTAMKRGLIKEAEKRTLFEVAGQVNSLGERLGEFDFVTAMTDVTGFGLIGHLTEMLNGTGLSADISYNSIPLLEGVENYIQQFCFPDNTTRNYNAYSKMATGWEGLNFVPLCDPQTNGGLMFTVDPQKEPQLISAIGTDQLFYIGSVSDGSEHLIRIK